MTWTALLPTSEGTHHADFQFVSLHGFQPHQGIDRAAHQDLVSHMELEDVGKLLGITWGGESLYICKPASALASHTARAGMELLGKHHNFLRVQRNKVKVEKQTKPKNQAEGPGQGIEAILAWIAQVAKSRRTLSQCPTLVPTKPALHMNSLFLRFSSLILSLCQVRMNQLLLLLSLPKEVWDGVGKDPCEIRKQTGHSGIFECHQGQCHLATTLTAG